MVVQTKLIKQYKSELNSLKQDRNHSQLNAAKSRNGLKLTATQQKLKSHFQTRSLNL